MDSPNPLVPFSPQCLLWGMLASVVEMQLGNSSNAEQFNGLHNEARVSRGAGSCGNFGGIPWGCHGHWLGDGVALEPACHLARASVTALGAFHVGTNELFGEDPSVV